MVFDTQGIIMSKDIRTFTPRPDAHASQWNELLFPVKKAIRDLLTRILGAVDTVNVPLDAHSHHSDDEISNCFLVSGERGNGKSTVLLNAAKAVKIGPENNFFPQENKDTPPPETEDSKYLRSTRQYAGKLRDRGVIWLDILDMEPLPATERISKSSWNEPTGKN